MIVLNVNVGGFVILVVMVSVRWWLSFVSFFILLCCFVWNKRLVKLYVGNDICLIILKMFGVELFSLYYLFLLILWFYLGNFILVEGKLNFLILVWYLNVLRLDDDLYRLFVFVKVRFVVLVGILGYIVGIVIGCLVGI